MGIKKLKKENKNLTLTLIDMLGKFDISKTKKYTQFLVNEIKKCDFDSFYNRDLLGQYFKEDNLEDKITNCLICYILGNEKMESFVEFCNLMEKGLVEEKDITKYNSWDKLMFELDKAKSKEFFKDSKKEVKIIFKNDDYIILKPLNHAASCKYGYNTKWCTSMRDDPEYFYRHSKGILIYVLDQKNKTKFGFYKALEDDEDVVFTIWNEKGNQIDSLQTELPQNILGVLLNEFKYNLEPNYKLFSNEELGEMLKHTYLEVSNSEESVNQPQFNQRPIIRPIRYQSSITTKEIDICEIDNYFNTK